MELFPTESIPNKTILKVIATFSLFPVIRRQLYRPIVRHRRDLPRMLPSLLALSQFDPESRTICDDRRREYRVQRNENGVEVCLTVFRYWDDCPFVRSLAIQSQIALLVSQN
jgi:hypothetical protein